jgi:phosphohistidine phosphatase SixA
MHIATRPRLATFVILLVLTVVAGSPAMAKDDAALWNAVRSGTAFAMMRHALAPGTGDPETVVIGDCTTQRNLSDSGRAQARAIGASFRANGIAKARVLSSAWCRCVETADLLGFGKTEVLNALNSFFTDRGREPAQTAALKVWISKDRPVRTAGNPLVLVTHQVNITALTGVFPRSGEIVIARLGVDGGVEVLGRLFPADAG